jgi:hypothetical protein
MEIERKSGNHANSLVFPGNKVHLFGLAWLAKALNLQQSIL